MVFVHGGSFQTGGIIAKGAEYFMEKDVVLVQVIFQIFNFPSDHSTDFCLINSEIVIESNSLVFQINYRLGYFGFMCTDGSDESAPGNAGLLDQILALKLEPLSYVHRLSESMNIDYLSKYLFITAKR